MLSESYSVPFPERISRKVSSEGMSVPTTLDRMELRGASQPTRCSSSSGKDTAAFWILQRQVWEVVSEVVRW
jgi:hypothetical protein